MIHIGAKALGMDTRDPDPSSDYHAMLWTCGRVRSSADLDHAGRAKVIEHLKSRGFNKKTAAPKVTQIKQALISKIGALINDMGLSLEYADGIARKMYKNDKVQWCNPRELRGIVAALVKKQAKQQEEKPND